MKDKIVFLDFDGVVNNYLWSTEYKDHLGELHCAFAFPRDGFVNNFQAICWLNELYTKYPFDIVVTSSWRMVTEYYTPEECLYNGGLNKNINIIGYIDPGSSRSYLINKWITDNNFTGDYIILDDEDYYTLNGSYRQYTPINYEYMTERFIHTDEDIGFNYIDYNLACNIFNKLADRTCIANKWYRCYIFGNYDPVNYIDKYVVQSPGDPNIICKNKDKPISLIDDADSECLTITDIVDVLIENEYSYKIITPNYTYEFRLI